MVLSTLGLLMSQLGHAQDYPVLRAEGCTAGQNIVFPTDANASVYMSGDCKTAFIIPREISLLKINDMTFGPIVTKDDCKRVANYDKHIDVAESQIMSLTLEIDRKKLELDKKIAESTSEEQAAKWEALYSKMILKAEDAKKDYKAERSELIKKLPFSKYEGVTANIELKLNLDPLLNEFILLNKDSGLRFRQAKIQKGVVSFTTVAANNDIELTSVIGAAIPGLTPDGKGTFTESENMLSNGGLSGYVTLSQPAACNLIRKLQKSEQGEIEFSTDLVTTSNISVAGFVANYAYEVPVSAEIDFEFQAATTSDNIKASFLSTKRKGQYNQENLSEILYSGALSNTINIKYGDGGISYPMKQFIESHDENLKTAQGNIFNVLFGAGMDLYLEAVISKLEKMKLIQSKEYIQIDIEDPQVTTQVNETVATSCKWKTTWYGKSKKKCSSYVKKDITFVDGVSIGSNQATDTTTFNIDMKVKSQYTLPMLHTTGFSTTKKGE